MVSQTLGTASAYVGWLVNQCVPQAAIDGLLTAIEGVLSGFDWAGKATLTPRFAPDLNDLRQCDRGADQVINFHIAIAIVEGGISGAVGLPALLIDIPAVITLALRMTRQIGVEYGYDADTEDERDFVFSVLSAAGANTQAEKVAALGMAAHLMNVLAKQSFKTMAQRAAADPLTAQALIITVRNLAKQLGINLTKRKMLAAIPVIGAVVGASTNGWFMREVGVAAQRLYQERWLRDRGLIVDGDLP